MSVDPMRIAEVPCTRRASRTTSSEATNAGTRYEDASRFSSSASSLGYPVGTIYDKGGWSMRATHAAAVILLLAFTTPAAAAEPPAKSEKEPVISCDQIVKVYKDNQSVDATSQVLFVDQSQVAQCLKAAGIDSPPEDDQ
jgi:hypothetical protein